jgi:enoyl-CoA hydratase/carnithine racemase
MDTLRLDRRGPVATLLIDRPDRRNALTQDMWDRLPELLQPIADDADVQLLVIRSAAPGVFSAGADVVEYRDNAGDVAWGLASQQRVSRALAAVRSVPAPTIAVVDGACVGGGAGIALACDLRLCSTRSFFALPPAKLGLVFPVEDTAALVRLVGPSNAKRILFTGSRFEADWAARVGFVDEVHPAESLEDAVDALTAQLLSVAPGSVRAMKGLVDQVQRGLDTSSPDTDRVVAAALAGPEHREGIAAFLERRPARFTAGPAGPAAPMPRG